LFPQEIKTFKMIIPSFLVAIASFAVAEASSILSSSSGLVERAASAPVINGSPGVMCYADAYNTIPGYNWNHTYTATEPQQVHISLTDDSKTARVQFATLGQIDQSILEYWPKQSGSKNKVTLNGQVRIRGYFSCRVSLLLIGTLLGLDLR
jgi:hypothetical protein